MDKNKYIGYRPTWAEVKLDNLDHNLAQIKKIIAPGIKVMACVKADAYGHGLIPVAKRLAFCGADYLGVASIDEGIKLREADIGLPILVLGAMLKNDIEPLFKYGLTATVCSEELALALNKRAASLHKSINIHIKIDTGMGRIGIMRKPALKIIRHIQRLKFVNIEGIFTHLACADSDKNFTSYQMDLFGGLIAELRRHAISIPLVHAANSAGIINYENSHFNMVRPGLIVYGLYPFSAARINLKPVLSLKTKAIHVKEVPKGCGISYGHTYVTKKNTTIVTLPIGYGDGYPRNLSNRAPVLIRGKRFKISGRICMDQMMVDVQDTPVKTGDEAILIGGRGKNRITVEELARLSGTIPYEITCGLGSRIPRLYI